VEEEIAKVYSARHLLVDDETGRKPMNDPPDPRRRKPVDDSEGLGMRLLAALIAAPLFELSLYLVIALISREWRSGFLFFELPLWLHLVYSGLAAGVGLIFGFSGLTWTLGHLFLTHREEEKSEWVTALLWCVVLALAALTYVLSPI
jgi:hypothetical protein